MSVDNFDEYFKQPTQEEVDKAWLRQLCYDGQMEDDEIDEFVEAVYQWKERCIEQNSHKHVVSGKRPDCPYCIEPISAEAIERWDNWIRNVKAACASGAVEKGVSAARIKPEAGAC